MKKLFFILIIGAASLGIIWTYQIYVGSLRLAVDPENQERILVEISPGMTATEVAERLKEKGLIRKASAFAFYLKRSGRHEKIRAGRVALSPNFTPIEIAEILTSGKIQELSVTLLEGWTIQQMAERLETLGLTSAEAFSDCAKTCSFEAFDFLPERSLEGYLFPDTYFVDPATFSEEGFLKRLIQTFRNRLDKDWDKIQKSGRPLGDIVIMASIVEREERDSKERPRVAGILWKRYDANRGLDADATILYGLGRTKGSLNYEDLKTDSLYNTRKYRGLPPTAISNPGLSSLRAALYPEESPYWYYLHDSEGQVHYGRTLEEHNENKAKYIKAGR